MTHSRALVLHDDPRTVAMLRALVAAEGFDVAAADSPYRLLEVAPDAAPDLLLLGLAGLDERDLELVGVLRRRWPRTTLLVLFPGLLRERAARCLDLGADGYLPEPFYAGEISSLARLAAGRAASRGAAPAASAALPAPGAPASDSAAGGRGGDEALGKLAAGVAHTIRNPLQILELQLGSFESDGKLDVQGMRDQLGRIAGVAESLTRFSGRRRLNTRLIDVNALVQRVFGEGARRGRAARIVATAERLEVLGAPDLLRAAVDAVHDRARRITPESAEIEVETSLVEVAGAPCAEIAVTDAGPPLPPEQVAALFDPFPDADHVVEGTGMEMAAAAGIVRNHGGSVSARPGGAAGTTVVLRLPARGRTAARPAGETP